MYPCQIHVQLSTAIRSATRLRDQLSSEHSSFSQRIWCRLRHAYLESRIRSLKEQLHRNDAKANRKPFWGTEFYSPTVASLSDTN